MNNCAAIRNSTHICLGVCTYQRPMLLLRCLSSVRRLREPERVLLSIVVVDNEPEPVNAANVLSFSTENGPFHYVHQPKRGIAQARNAIIDKAAELRADWIAMLDDDQLVPSDWLFWMWQAARDEAADIVYNAVEDELPKNLPLWAFPKRKRRTWRIGVSGCSTNGVLFNARLVNKFGTPLRFDERFALTGGEDRDFIKRAWIAGAKIVWTPEAVSTEIVPASKLTFSAQVWRAYWIEAVNARQDRGYHGFLAALVMKSVKASGALLQGLWRLATVPFVGLISEHAARRQLLKGAKQLAKAAGIAVGLAGTAHPQPYRTIHGS